MNRGWAWLPARARWVIGLVLATAAVYLLEGVLAFAVIVAFEGESIGEKVLVDMTTGSAIELLLFLGGAVAWLIWQSSVYRRVAERGRTGLKTSPGWAAAWYFIPVANIWMPIRTMQELTRASDPASPASEWQQAPAGWVAPAWWITFILGNTVSRLSTTAGFLGGSRDALFWADALSAPLVACAAVLAVVLILRLESNLRALGAGMSGAAAEGVAPDGVAAQAVALARDETEQPFQVVHAFGGAVVGAALVTAWWVFFWLFLSIAGASFGSWWLAALTAIPAAIAAGVLAGALTQFTAGGRGVAVTVAAGLAAFLGIVAGNLVYSFPMHTLFIRYLASHPSFIFSVLGQSVFQPVVPVAVIVAVGSAIAVTMLRPPAKKQRAEPGAPAASGVSEGGMAAAPAIGAPADTVGAGGMAAPPPGAPPAPVVAARAPAERRGKGIVIAAVTVAVVLVATGAIVSGFAVYRAITAALGPGPVAAPGKPKTSTTEQPAAESTYYASPEDAVRALYAAAASNDAARLAAVMAPGFYLDAGVLQSWGKPTYRIVNVVQDTVWQQVRVEVEEPGGGLPGDVVTWHVQKQSTSGWKVNGYFSGKAADEPSYFSGPSNATPDQRQAIGALESFLQRRVAHDMPAAKELATAKLKRDHPEIFDYKPGAFRSYEIAPGSSLHGDYSMNVKEEWSWGPIVHQYVVVNENGKYLVDQMN